MSPHYRLRKIRYGYRVDENHRQIAHPEEQTTIKGFLPNATTRYIPEVVREKPIDGQ